MDDGPQRIDAIMADSNDNSVIDNHKMISTNSSVNIARTAAEQLFEKIVERVFLIRPKYSDRPHTLSVVVMQDCETSIAPEELEHVLFGRLLMSRDALQAANISAAVSDSDSIGSADEPNPLLYLGECFLRLQQLHTVSSSSITVEQYSLMQRMIMQNLATGLAVPDVFPDAPPASLQLVDFAFKHYGLLAEYVADLLDRLFFYDNALVTMDIDELLFPVFEEIEIRVKNINSQGPELVLSNVQALQPVFFLLATLCKKSKGASSFMLYSSINNSQHATACERTLLGRLLYASSYPVLTPQRRPKFEFFPSTVVHNPTNIAAAEQFVWAELINVVDGVFSIVNNIIRTSTEARELFCRWVGTALSSNKHRGRPFDPETEEPPEEGSHGFMLNLLHLLLVLCQPFLGIRDPKLLRINWLYAGVPAAKAHLSALHDETTLIQKPEQGDALKQLNEIVIPDSAMQSFITAVFFFTHYCVKVGFNTTLDKLKRVVETMGQTREFIEFMQNAPPSQSTIAHLERAKLQHEMFTSIYVSLRAMLACPKRLRLLVDFALCTSQWCTQLALRPRSKPDGMPIMPPLDAFLEPKFPLSEADAPQMILCFVPEMCIETVEDVLQTAFRFHDDPRLPFELDLSEERAREIITTVLVFMGSPARMRNPHLRAKMASLLCLLLPPSAQTDRQHSGGFGQRSFTEDYEQQRSAVFNTHPQASYMIGTLLHVFCAIELTGSGVSFEYKFIYRRPMFSLLRFLIQIPQHRAQLDSIARDAIVHIDDADAPLFLRFASLLCDDANFLLNEGLTYMVKLKDLEKEREEAWPALPPNQRQRREQEMEHMARIARFHNQLGLDTIDAVRILTEIDGCVQLLTHPVMCERIASMLDYFLFNLVNPQKRKVYKTKNLEDFSFEPRKLLALLVECYSNLGGSSSAASTTFLEAVIADERSYSPEMINNTLELLESREIGTPEQVHKMQHISQRLQTMEKLQKEEDELLAEDGDIPDEFKDDLMASIMRDPVQLPLSKNIVDRKTIARHLISSQNDPFNRMPLTMQDVVPLPELRQKIEAWLEEKRTRLRAKQQVLASDQTE